MFDSNTLPLLLFGVFVTFLFFIHQNFLRHQNNKTNYNLVCETLQFLDCICGSTTGGLGLLGLYINERNVALVNQTLESLTEYCQGPCHENQVWLKDCRVLHGVPGCLCACREPFCGLESRNSLTAAVTGLDMFHLSNPSNENSKQILRVVCLLLQKLSRPVGDSFMSGVDGSVA